MLSNSRVWRQVTHDFLFKIEKRVVLVKLNATDKPQMRNNKPFIILQFAIIAKLTNLESELFCLFVCLLSV